MGRNIVRTDNAPAPVGTYNQAAYMDAGKILFTAGQIAIDPKTNEVVLGDIKEQTRLVLNNLKAILDASGSSMDNLLKLTVFMTDLGDFSSVNEVFEEFFPETPPARSAVEVSALPKNVNIEIEGIAVIL